ncbi:MAG TPA: methyltransferase domain-containing protein [Thermoanaerobaculia bacterium]|nr:methyltransferase domain-containing protein [Thermoanaerobaculia bacterium]
MSPEHLAYSDAESSSPLVQALCRDLLAGGVSFDVHADDEMLHFFLYRLGYPAELAIATYLDSGRRIWKTFRQIISWRFGSPRACGRILDFASGYGRVTRHIVAEVPRESVWVADIYAEGVAFQKRAFGVHGIVSTSDPDGFHVETEFDCILVSSLFTHLPPARFSGWLRRLGAALAPGGMLLFSVHDLSLWRDGPPPASDIAFVPMSESGSLSPQEYGTTWVSEEYVRSATKAALETCAVHRIPRGLANFQDLYVVIAGVDDAAAASAAFTGLRVERSVDGVVEHCSRLGQRRLKLSGWVADRVTGRPPQAVHVRIGGALAATCRVLEPRDSLAFPSDPITAVGWQLTVDLPPGPTDGAVMSVSVLASNGEELELCSDSVLGALLRSAHLDLFALQGRLHEEAARRAALAVELNGRIEALSSQIRGMEASRFWKLRNYWFRLKRLAGLTREP